MGPFARSKHEAAYRNAVRIFERALAKGVPEAFQTPLDLFVELAGKRHSPEDAAVLDVWIARCYEELKRGHAESALSVLDPDSEFGRQAQQLLAGGAQ